jgi:glycosyltransferase involved in cell wall biosynthesis
MVAARGASRGYRNRLIVREAYRIRTKRVPSGVYNCDQVRARVLIFIVAYNAERTIQSVLRRIPAELSQHDTHVLIIDDSSSDATFERAHEIEEAPFPTTVLFNPVNQGYGGNQKIGFHYAIREKFDFVALVHGDGQYAPERLPDLLQPLLAGEADAVFGSRMLDAGGARRGGMPLYKWLGNKILTRIQNRLLKTNFSEFHSGYRIYSVQALAGIPFGQNTNDFHFDTEIIIQFVRAGLRIKELPIPTYYGDEICRVNGMKYALDVVRTTALSRAQDLGILYERKFDLAPPGQQYLPKWGFESPHELAVQRVPSGSKVADIGCASGYVARALFDKGCDVTGIDQYRPPEDAHIANFVIPNFILADLNGGEIPVDAGAFDYVLLLDIIEHLRSPETFVESLRNSRRQGKDVRVIVSTGNVAFVITRCMLFLGFFHYGARGILDLTHTRLFTFATIRKLFEQANYRIEEIRGIPAPFPLALGDTALARFLVGVNRFLIKISRSLFSYQIFLVARPLPSLEVLLEGAIASGDTRAALASMARVATLPDTLRPRGDSRQ